MHVQNKRDVQPAPTLGHGHGGSSSVLHNLVPPQHPAALPLPPPAHTVASANELAWEGQVGGSVKAPVSALAFLEPIAAQASSSNLVFATCLSGITCCLAESYCI